MPELRKDPIVGRWVIVAENRAGRPHELVEAASLRDSLRPCPFCEGHEGETPGEVAAIRAPQSRPNGPGWRVRVVPNQFPALEPGGELHRVRRGLYDSMHGVGAHEVIVETPRHVGRTTDLGPGDLAEVLGVYRDRLLDLKQDRRLVYGMLFKNVGAAAGASLEHTHSQLIVTPILPISVAEELSGSEAFWHARGECIYCDIAAEERAAGQRMVVESAGFVAFCPFASRFPFETWVVPRRHASHYETISQSDCHDLAEVLWQVLSKIDVALARPAYNYILHTAPFDTLSLDHYHWHIEIIPRVTKTAGFEWGTGFYINPVPPEQAAGTMRALAGALQKGQQNPTTKTG